MRAAPACTAALVTLLACGARADAIMGPPTDCPPGSIGESSHTDTFCQPIPCAADSECTVRTAAHDLVCAPVGLCIESRTRTEGGLMPVGVVPRTLVYDVASSSCSTDADCAAGTTCVVAPRCTTRGAVGFVRHAFGCAIGRRAASWAAVLAPALVAVALLLRRRRP